MRIEVPSRNFRRISDAPREDQPSNILDFILELQSTIYHAKVVVRRAGCRGGKGIKVESSETVVVEGLGSNDGEGGPIAIGENE
jgi:hypothetical protein